MYAYRIMFTLLIIIDARNTDWPKIMDREKNVTKEIARSKSKETILKGQKSKKRMIKWVVGNSQVVNTLSHELGRTEVSVESPRVGNGAMSKEAFKLQMTEEQDIVESPDDPPWWRAFHRSLR